MSPNIELDFEGALLSSHGGLERNSLINLINNASETESIVPDNLRVNQSRYYDIDSFLSTLKSSQNSFSVLSLNIAGLRNNFSEFEILINEIKSRNIDLSVILLQETHQNADEMDLFQLGGYNLVSTNKFVSNFGGLAIYINENLELNCI